MNLQELHYVLTIASEKNLSKAARKIHITQPALSLFLTRLEKQLGTPLFNRNGMQPTYAGKKYIAMAMKIEQLYRNFELDLCSINHEQVGDLRIGTAPHIGSSILPYVLPRFAQIYPGFEVSIIEGRTNELEDKLEHNEVDLAFIHLPVAGENIAYELIGRAHYVLAVKKGSPLNKLSYKKPEKKFPFVPVDTLKNKKFIMAFPHQGVRRIVDEIFKTAGIQPQIAFLTSSVETALLFAGAGLGYALLPEDYLHLFQCGDLEPDYYYLEESLHPYWDFVVGFHSPSLLSTPEKEFIKLTKEAFQKSLRA